ncbi:MAG: response regulator transcription factor [Dehalococcoidales bacterium]|jgi:two-component system KDP operon response regulator KdpE
MDKMMTMTKYKKASSSGNGISNNVQVAPVKHKFSVLIVDDEERILNFLKTKLRTTGYDVMLAVNGIEALDKVKEQEPDLIVMDVIMPKMDGFQTLKELRTFSTVPVIMLSARGDDSDRIKGLGLGADDYLPKPFNPDELVARIGAIKRRLSSMERKSTLKTMVIGDLKINFEEHRIFVRGEEVKMTRIEWLVLTELAGDAGHLVPYYDLLSRIWGPEYRNDVQILRTWISRLRQKIEPNPANPEIICMVPKIGYIFKK